MANIPIKLNLNVKVNAEQLAEKLTNAAAKKQLEIIKEVIAEMGDDAIQLNEMPPNTREDGQLIVATPTFPTEEAKQEFARRFKEKTEQLRGN